MNHPVVVGVDVGTSGIKAAVYDDAGRLLSSAYEETHLIQPSPGVVEQDPDELVAAVCRTIRASVDEAGLGRSKVAALALTGQMASIMGIDRKGEPTTPVDSWLDTRCAKYIPMIAAEAGRVIALSGGPATYSHGAKLLWWKGEHRSAFNRTVRFLMPSAFVVAKLAGLRATDSFIDPTYLQFSCLSDTENGAWSDELCETLGVPSDKLPTIVEPPTIVGRISRQAASATGLAAGTPIAAGAGDQAAGLLGAGIVHPRLMLDVAGTASLLAFSSDAFRPDFSGVVFTGRAVHPGLWYSMAYINGGGLNLRWFRDAIAPDIAERAAGSGTSAYAALDRLAEQVPAGSDELVFIPHLGGRVCPSEPQLRGMWQGFSWTHRRAHLYRAMLEGVAFEYRHFIGVEVGRGGRRPTAARVVGGGARSRLWNQIKADVLGIPYARMDHDDVALFGAAIIAGNAVGVFPDMVEAASRLASVGVPVLPRESLTTYYKSLAETYDVALSNGRVAFSHLEGIRANGSAEIGKGES